VSTQRVILYFALHACHLADRPACCATACLASPSSCALLPPLPPTSTTYYHLLNDRFCNDTQTKACSPKDPAAPRTSAPLTPPAIALQLHYERIMPQARGTAGISPKQHYCESTTSGQSQSLPQQHAHDRRTKNKQTTATQGPHRALLGLFPPLLEACSPHCLNPKITNAAPPPPGAPSPPRPNFPMQAPTASPTHAPTRTLSQITRGSSSSSIYQIKP
jgi:hypothetical protein